MQYDITNYENLTSQQNLLLCDAVDTLNMREHNSNYHLCVAMGEILRCCLSGIAKGAKGRESAEFWAFSCDVVSAWDNLFVKSFAKSRVSDLVSDSHVLEYARKLRQLDNEWHFSAIEYVEIFFSLAYPNLSCAAGSEENKLRYIFDIIVPINLFDYALIHCDDDKDKFLSLIREFNRCDNFIICYSEVQLRALAENVDFLRTPILSRLDSDFGDAEARYFSNENIECLSGLERKISKILIGEVFDRHYNANIDLASFLTIYFPLLQKISDNVIVDAGLWTNEEVVYKKTFLDALYRYFD